MHNQHNMQRLEHIWRLVGNYFGAPGIHRIAGDLLLTQPRRTREAEARSRAATVLTPILFCTHLGDLAGADQHEVSFSDTDFAHGCGTVEISRIDRFPWFEPRLPAQARNIKEHTASDNLALSVLDAVLLSARANDLAGGIPVVHLVVVHN